MTLTQTDMVAHWSYLQQLPYRTRLADVDKIHEKSIVFELILESFLPIRKTHDTIEANNHKIMLIIQAAKSIKLGITKY